jgi:hypothetical protein
MFNKIINLSIYLLRYFSLINTKYNVSNKINFGSTLSNNYFKKNLIKCNYYLEFGSGNSTILAKQLNKKFRSIESDKSFYRFMRSKKIKDILYSDLGPTRYYSIPILPSFLLKNKIEKYADQIKDFVLVFNKLPDLVLVDGRFRVFVVLKIINFCLSRKEMVNTIIILDDFKYREDYHILKKILKINLVGRLGVIKLNKKTQIEKKKLSKFMKASILNYA